MLFTEFQSRIIYLAKVREAFLKLKEFDFVALAAEEGSTEGQSGCRFSLCQRRLKTATKWVANNISSPS